MANLKKYKLRKATDAPHGDKPLCAFFSSPDGCRNGDKCSFSHISGNSDKFPAAAEVSESASVISSEESFSRDFFSPPASSAKKHSTTASEKKPSSSTTAVESRKISRSDQTNMKRKARTSNGSGDLFANPKQKEAISPANPKQKEAISPAKKRLKASVVAKSAHTPKTNDSLNFRALVSTLPISSFSIPGIETGPPGCSAGSPGGDDKKRIASSPSIDPSEILPTSSEASKRWIKAIQFSRKHERYTTAFNFARYKEINKEAGVLAEWIKARPFGDWSASNPQAIAIDCEMCETQDPLSGAKNAKALCRMSVVNADNPEEVLLDTLVKPVWPVTDYRTKINGIRKEDLDNVQFTLRHAQAFMMALCSTETVIIGHAVQNDLAALFMEHHCVADSSFLFLAKDSTTASVSLKDLVFSISKKEMPETHDSVNDARKALECVVHWVEHDGNVDTVERTSKNKGDILFVHRIPKQCKIPHLMNMFLKNTCIEPTSIDEVEFTGEMGKTHVTFRSARHASLAFDTLEGTAEPDKSGKLQKKVYLRNGDYVRVRKMNYTRTGKPTKSTPKKSEED